MKNLEMNSVSIQNFITIVLTQKDIHKLDIPSIPLQQIPTEKGVTSSFVD
jgi:hypothetical protein